MTARRRQPILYIAVEEIPCAARSGKISFRDFHSAYCGLKNYFRLSRVFSRTATRLFQNPAEAFRHTHQCISADIQGGD
jgi:hypothetical protein